MYLKINRFNEHKEPGHRAGKMRISELNSLMRRRVNLNNGTLSGEILFYSDEVKDYAKRHKRSSIILLSLWGMSVVSLPLFTLIYPSIWVVGSILCMISSFITIMLFYHYNPRPSEFFELISNYKGCLTDFDSSQEIIKDQYNSIKREVLETSRLKDINR